MMSKFEKAAIARRAFRERGPMTILEAMHATKISAECLRSVVCAPEYEIVKPRGGGRLVRCGRYVSSRQL